MIITKEAFTEYEWKLSSGNGYKKWNTLLMVGNTSIKYATICWFKNVNQDTSTTLERIWLQQNYAVFLILKCLRMVKQFLITKWLDKYCVQREILSNNYNVLEKFARNVSFYYEIMHTTISDINLHNTDETISSS